ncbi:hypothetical protein [Chitinimonas naiadis]
MVSQETLFSLSLVCAEILLEGNRQRAVVELDPKRWMPGSVGDGRMLVIIASGNEIAKVQAALSQLDKLH